METTKIKAVNLKVGDELATGERVVVAPSSGLRTPKGKCELQLTTKDGGVRWATWGKTTLIAVKA